MDYESFRIRKLFEGKWRTRRCRCSGHRRISLQLETSVDSVEGSEVLHFSLD